MTVLYHGNNVRFEKPDVDAGREGLDFGKGFYLTPNLDTAKKQADFEFFVSGVIAARMAGTPQSTPSGVPLFDIIYD